MSLSAFLSICVTLALFTTCTVIAHDNHGQKESEAHGGRSPHEKFRDEHYKDGEHDEHMDHQAILGSKKTAAEFDKLPAEESKKRLRVLAKRMDTNSDGFVDAQELTNWIHTNLKRLDKEETEERFDEIDENKDSIITWEEYKKDAFGEDEVTDPDDQKLVDEDVRYFKSADKSNDGKLDKAEFMAFQNPEHHEHMHDALIENTLKDKDKDNDRHINLEEFLGEYAGKKDTEWYASESERFANNFDKNKDGKLDVEEMKLWLVPNVLDTAKEESQHLFQEADKNKDAQLSIDEIVDAYNLFVGSEATNYGEHLDKVSHSEL